MEFDGVSYPRFRAYKETALTATAEVITIQLPPNASKLVEFIGELVVWCDVSVDVTIELNGSSATSAAITPTPLNIAGATPTALAKSASNASGGAVIDKFSLDGGSTVFNKLSDVVLNSGKSTPQNLTVRTSAITGNVRIRLDWAER